MTQDREQINYRPSKTTRTWLEKASSKLKLSKSLLSKRLMLLARHELDWRYYPFIYLMVATKNRNDPESKSIMHAEDFEECCEHVTNSIQQFKFLGMQFDENQRCGAIIKVANMFCALHDNNFKGFKEFNFIQFGKDAMRDRLLDIAWQNEPKMKQ